MKLSVAFCPSKNLSEYAPYPFVGDIQNCIKEAKKYNFNSVELSIRTPEDLDIKKCEASFSEYGLSISAIATCQNFIMDGLCFVSPEKVVRDEVVRRLKLNIDFALKHRTSVIIGGLEEHTLLPPNSLCTLMIYCPTLPVKHGSYPWCTVSSILGNKIKYSSCEAILVWQFLDLVSLS